MTDIERWRRVAAEPSLWLDRLRLIARHIQPESSVLDVGAGGQDLRNVLPPGCAYQAIDCVPGDGVIVWDANADAPPQIARTYDVAVLSGVLEHVERPISVLVAATAWARRVLFSYVFREWARDWPGRLSIPDIATACYLEGIGWRPVAIWNDQTICEASPDIWVPSE